MPFFDELCKILEAAAENERKRSEAKTKQEAEAAAKAEAEAEKKFFEIFEEAKKTLEKKELTHMLNGRNEVGWGLLHLTDNQKIIETLIQNGVSLFSTTEYEVYSVFDLYIQRLRKYNQKTVCYLISLIFTLNLDKDQNYARELKKIGEIKNQATRRCDFFVMDSAMYIDKCIQIKNALWAAIENNDAQVFAKRLKEALEHTTIPFDPNRPNEAGCTMLDLAIRKSAAGIVEALLALKDIDVNLESEKLPPLHRAIQTIYKEVPSPEYFINGPLVDIVTALVNHPKTNLKRPYNEYRCLLSKLTVAFHRENFPKLKSEIVAIWNKLATIAILSLRNDLKGLYEIEGYKVDLEGSGMGVPALEMMHSFSDFLKDEKVRKEMNGLFNFIENTRDTDYMSSKNPNLDFATRVFVDFYCIVRPMELKEFLERERLGMITPISVCVSTNEDNSNAHAIGYCAYGNLLARINCGSSSDVNERSGVKFWSIGNKNHYHTQMEKLLKSVKKAIPDKELLNDFVRICELKPEADFEIIFPDQLVGNCALRSLEVLLFTVMFLHLYRFYKVNFPDMGNKECFLKAQKYSRILFDRFIRYDRERGLTQFAAVRSALPPNVQTKLKENAEMKIKEDRDKDQFWVPHYDEKKAQELNERENKQRETKQQETKQVQTKQEETKKKESKEDDRKKTKDTLKVGRRQLYAIARKTCGLDEEKFDKLLKDMDEQHGKNETKDSYNEFLSQLDGVESILPMGDDEFYRVTLMNGADPAIFLTFVCQP